MNIPTIQKFLLADSVQRIEMVKNSQVVAELETYLGASALSEYVKLAERLDTAHLSVTAPTNLIFIPGIMGSLLKSETKGGIWWIDARTRKHINDLRLSPDGQSDADNNNQVVPCSVDPGYEPFLTAVLARDDFGHAVFPYDWRKPLSSSTRALRNLILKLYENNGEQPVHLVGHSMGGLMIRSTLMSYGQELWPKVGRIVFIATPHYGSPTIAMYVKNHLCGFDLMGVLGKYLSRDTFRSLYGAMCLLPAPKGVYPGTRVGDPNPWRGADITDKYTHPCSNFDMYDADSWKLELTPQERENFQRVLTAQVKFHEDLYNYHHKLSQELRDRMYVIAGVGYQTLSRLRYAPEFFGLWEKMDKVTSRVPNDPNREGDGRVTLASAAIENVHIRYVKGVHAGLPNIPDVYEDVFRWLNEQSLKLPETVEEAVSQHLAVGSNVSEAPHLDGTYHCYSAANDDPGFWDFSDGTAKEEWLKIAEQKLERGEMPEFNTIKLL